MQKKTRNTLPDPTREGPNPKVKNPPKTDKTVRNCQNEQKCQEVDGL